MHNIAVIEDDHTLNDHYRDLIAEIPDVIVHQAFNSAEGRSLLNNGEIDLVLLDIELDRGTSNPRSGFDLLKEFGPKMVIIIVTGMPEEILHEMSIRLKAFEFVRKPANPLVLLNKLRHALQFENSETVRVSREAQAWPKGVSFDPELPLTLFWNGKPVTLTMTELKAAMYLAQRQGQVANYEQLADAALKSGDSARVVQQHFSKVRSAFLKVDSKFDRIRNEPNKGYIWKPDA